MVAWPTRGGLTPAFRLPNPPSFGRPSGHLLGNDLPPQTGWSLDATPAQPGPGGHALGSGGQQGAATGFWGPDPTQPERSPFPRRVAPAPEGGVAGAGPALGAGTPASTNQPLTYGQGATRLSGIDAWGWAGRLAAPCLEDPLPAGRPSWWRGGIQGFSDKLTAKDRHAYWDQGHQRQGTDFTPASSPPNTFNNPLQEPPLPELRTVNRTVSYQLGTDTSRYQDDLTRGYTWLGEQGSGWSPVLGGVPGLYQPYGTRGGVPYPIVSPVAEGAPGDGPHKVWAGPPHGLHSQTYPDRGDTLNRYQVNPQMRPVRIDRPSNSTAAGQSYSQTVKMQGSTVTVTGSGKARSPGLTGRLGRRGGWAGS